MGEHTTNPPTPLSLTVWLIRHSPSVSEAAMVLFVVLAGLSLAVATANHGALSIWYRVGIAGIVLTLGSLICLLWPVIHKRGRSEPQRPRGCSRYSPCWPLVFWRCSRFVSRGLFELLLVVAAGTGAASVIAVLVVAQPVLVGAVALVVERVSGSALRALVSRAAQGMVCPFGSSWHGHHLRDHGHVWMVNVLVVSGGWLPARWPGVLTAMAVLTGTAVVCAPGIIRRAEGRA